MAIHMMTDASKAGLDNVQTVTDYPGCETWRVHHHYDCKHDRDAAYLRERGPECGERCKHYDPLYIETTYEGHVLSTREHNGYDDSDFYATVWDDEQGKPVSIMYATTRGWTYCNGAQVDATPEVQAKADAYMARGRRQQEIKNDVAQAKMPYKGREVRVVKGRKVPVGTTAVVFWIGEDGFRNRRYDNPMAEAMGLHKFNLDRYRVGIEWTDATGKHREFTAASNVAVVNPDSYRQLSDDEQAGQ